MGSLDTQGKVERGYSMSQHNLLKEQGKVLFYLFYLLASSYPGSSVGWRNVPFMGKL